MADMVMLGAIIKQCEQLEVAALRQIQDAESLRNDDNEDVERVIRAFKTLQDLCGWLVCAIKELAPDY